MTKTNPPHIHQRVRIGLWVSLFVLIALKPCSSAGQWAQEPVGYIRTMDGAVRIESGSRTREAEPFAPVFANDRVVVENGTAVVCDVRTGESTEVHAGKPFSLPQTVAHPNAGLRERLVTAFQALTSEPEQTGKAMVRGIGVAEPRPNEVAFAPGAHVFFRWIGHDQSAQLSLFRLTPEPELVYRADVPSSHMTWPAGVVPVAGRYKWEARDKDGTALGSGQFILMTSEEAATQRERYRAQATDKFGPESRELMIELLAAQDGYFLK
jgi:hypothetical protein